MRRRRVCLAIISAVLLPSNAFSTLHALRARHTESVLHVRTSRPVLVLGDNDSPILPGSAPDGPGQAIGIVAELKGNAALFAAFSFGALSLPGTLTVSESKATGLGTAISTSRPLPDSDLLTTFVLLDACTLCLMITCVATSQLLIYRLADGSYGTKKFSRDGHIDRRDTALGRLVTQYGSYFRVARASFALGLGSLLAAVAVKTNTVFDSSVALPVTTLIGAASATILSFFLQTRQEIFKPLMEMKAKEDSEYAPSGPATWALPAVAGACIGASVVLFAPQVSSLSTHEGQTAASTATARYAAQIKAKADKEIKAVADKAADKAIADKAASEKAAAGKAIAEKAAAEKLVAEKNKKAAAEKAAAPKAA